MEKAIDSFYITLVVELRLVGRNNNSSFVMSLLSLFFFFQQEAITLLIIETVQISSPASVTLLKCQKKSSFQMVTLLIP